MLEKSCGTIPYTVRDGKVYYLLIKNKNNEYCGFPKGHVEANENEVQTALRETLEETSLHVNILEGFRHKISYQMSNGNKKDVIYFLASFKDQEPRQNEGFENFDYLLLPFEKAYQRLTFDNSRQMLMLANDFLKNSRA